jgi:hypothetical protein
MEALGAALGGCAAEPTECTWSEASESSSNQSRRMILENVLPEAKVEEGEEGC